MKLIIRNTSGTSRRVVYQLKDGTYRLEHWTLNRVMQWQLKIIKRETMFSSSLSWGYYEQTR